MDIYEAVFNLRVTKEIDQIHQAMWGNRLVEINYVPVDEFAPVTRIVEPYSFRKLPQGIMFYGWDIHERKTKSFYADRIRSVRVQSTKFKPKWDVEPESIQDLAEGKAGNPFPFATAVLEEGDTAPVVVYEAVANLSANKKFFVVVEKDHVEIPVADPQVALPEEGLKTRGEYHITVVTPPEMKEILDRHGWNWETLHTKINGAPVEGKPRYVCLGKQEKGDNAVYYIVVEWGEVNEIRRKMGLQAKDLHVTLGFRQEDIHDVLKNQGTCIRQL